MFFSKTESCLLWPQLLKVLSEDRISGKGIHWQRSPRINWQTDNNTQRKQPLFPTSSHGSFFESSTLQLWTLKPQTIQFCENNLAQYQGKQPLTRVQTISNGIIFLGHQLLHCLITAAVLKSSASQEVHIFVFCCTVCTQRYDLHTCSRHSSQSQQKKLEAL